MGTGLEFGILGPLEVRVGGRLVHVGGPRQRALLSAVREPRSATCSRSARVTLGL